ncbi:unannotated protein [freshwater metagenome]
MRETGCAMRCEFHVIETAMAFCCARETLTVLLKTKEWIKERFEMALADKRSAVAGLAQNCSNAGRFDRKWDTIHPDAVRADVLASDHGGARRHTHNVLRLGTVIGNAVGRE